MSDTPPTVETVRHLLAASTAPGVTPGPWIDRDTEDCTHPAVHDKDFGTTRIINEADYDFACEAVNAIEAICRRLITVEEESAALRQSAAAERERIVAIVRLRMAEAKEKRAYHYERGNFEFAAWYKSSFNMCRDILAAIAEGSK